MFMYAAVDSHKNGEEARAEKEKEGETDASSQPSSTQDQFSIWSALPPPAPRPADRQAWKNSARLDEITLQQRNSVTCQALSRRFEACLPPLASLPLDHGRCFQYCFCQMSAVAQSAMQPGASSAAAVLSGECATHQRGGHLWRGESILVCLMLASNYKLL